MANVAAVDFPLARGLVEAGDDLDELELPVGTMRYLTRRGLVVGGPTLSCAVPFGAFEADDPVDAGDFSVNVLTRLIARGYVVGA